MLKLIKNYGMFIKKILISSKIGLECTFVLP